MKTFVQLLFLAGNTLAAASVEPAPPALPTMPAPVSGPDFRPQDDGSIADDDQPDTQAIQQAGPLDGGSQHHHFK